MITDFQRQKYEAAFDQLDENGNGLLELSDFTAHANYIRNKKGWSDDNKHFAALIEAKKKLWQEIQTRTGSTDPDVSKEQWVSFWGKLAMDIKQSGKAPDWVTKIHVTLFSSFDLNNDSEITLEEFSFYLESIRSSADPKEAFTKLDLNGDGSIDIEELEELMAQWILSDNPDAPGNFVLLGK
jgi:Ca2+-binding EF-hand superfamily protein